MIELLNISRRRRFYYITVVFFLYATLLVDMYRKAIGINTTVIRNIVYSLNLVFILLDMIHYKHFEKMLVMLIIVSLLFVISYALNDHRSVYLSEWLFFILRLWPAFYVGKYTEDWAIVSHYARKWIWIALLYVFIAFFGNPETDTVAYATLAANLFFVVWIAYYESFREHRILGIIICSLCFVPILFFGTRACLFGALLSIVLLVILQSQGRLTSSKLFFWLFFIAFLILIIVFFSNIIIYLVDLFPNSRSLSYLIKGDVLNDSNRSKIYEKIINSLIQNPFKFHGLLGDRIYLAGKGASDNIILSFFSHNVCLELCMNFGLLPGIFLSLYFLVVLVSAFRRVKYCDNALRYMYAGVLGLSFVNMMVSSSYLGSYYIWLLFGLAYNIRQFSSQPPNSIKANE